MNLNDRQVTVHSVLAAAGAWIVGRVVLDAAARRHASETASEPRRVFAPSFGQEFQPRSNKVAAPDQSWKSIAIRLYEAIGEDRILAVSAGITFYSLLAIFPAVAAFLAVYGFFAEVGTVQSHLASLAGILPSGALDVIGDQVRRIASKGGSTLGFAFAVGFLASLWSANAGIKALIDGLNIAYGRPESRGFIKQNLISLGFTVGGLGCVLAAFGFVVIAPLMLRYVGFDDAGQTIISVGRWPALLLIVLLALAVLYRYGATPRGATWRWITPGSAVAALLWLLASAGFSFYASHFGSYNETYGSLGAAVGFMTWIWISTIVILIGAELNGIIERGKQSYA
jgi:membrane protein